MIRQIRSVLFVLAGMSLFIPMMDAKADPTRDVVLSCTNFPPSKIETPKDGLPGFAIEFLRTAFLRSGTHVEIKFYPWKRALMHVMRGAVDGLCSCSYDPSRNDKLIYSDPLGENGVVVFYNRSNKPAPIKSLDGLSERKVGVVRGYSLQQELVDRNVKPTLVNDEVSGIKLLIGGRIEFFYSFKDPALYALANHFEERDIGYFEIKKDNYYACFNKFAPDVANTVKNLNAGLAAIRADGTYDRILEKYR